jgi:hypothetical protein
MKTSFNRILNPNKYDIVPEPESICCTYFRDSESEDRRFAGSIESEEQHVSSFLLEENDYRQKH